jgi:hypothetical protein
LVRCCQLLMRPIEDIAVNIDYELITWISPQR